MEMNTVVIKKMKRMDMVKNKKMKKMQIKKMLRSNNKRKRL
jgi:hypothetical protein